MTTSKRASTTKFGQNLALGILIAWLCLCATLFWWFQFRHINHFEDYWASFQGETFKKNRIQPTQGYAVVIHFIDNSCPCSRFAEPHISDLELQYGNDVEFIRFGSGEMNRLTPIDLNQLRVPASPAVAIWDQKGDLAYLGPYSGGVTCGQGTDFVALTLENLKERQNPQWFNQESVGCFCEWRTPQELLHDL